VTVQEPDYVYYKRRKYELVSVDSDGLFNPTEHGFDLFAPHTACWRGYIATYAIKNQELLLRNLDCWSNPESTASLVGGHLPVESTPWGELNFKQLEHQIPYTGYLILGGGEILGQFDYFADWTIYELVHECQFQQGRLVKTRDLSAEAAQRRLHSEQ